MADFHLLIVVLILAFLRLFVLGCSLPACLPRFHVGPVAEVSLLVIAEQILLHGHVGVIDVFFHLVVHLPAQLFLFPLNIIQVLKIYLFIDLPVSEQAHQQDPGYQR